VLAGAPRQLLNFFAFEDTLRNGAFVSAGDVTGDGRADLILAAPWAAAAGRATAGLFYGLRGPLPTTGDWDVTTAPVALRVQGEESGAGNAGANRLLGWTGADTLDGGAGADTLEGWTGNDYYIVDDAADAVVELSEAGNDTVGTTLDAFDLGTLPNLENLEYLGGGAFHGIEEVVERRTGVQGMGFGAELRRGRRKSSELLKQVTNEDLLRFGMIPEFVGRLPVVATLEELQRPTANQSRNLHAIVDRVRPSVEQLLATELRHDMDALVRQGVRANIRASVNHLRHGSQVLEQLIQDEGLRVVGAEYSLESGVVEFFDGAA